MVDWPAIGATVKAARESRGWSQQALADRAGVSHALVGFVETASRTNYLVESLAKIAAALDLRITLEIGAETAAPDLERLESLARQAAPEDRAFAIGFLERCVRPDRGRIAS